MRRTPVKKYKAVRNSPKSATREGGEPTLKERFLTPTEVADRLLVAPVTVRLWASKGLLPSVTTLGRHRRFRESDVEAFVLRHQHAGKRVEVERPDPPSVLIIDDDAQFARYLARLITAHLPGVRVETALDGFSAGLKCQSMRPDVVTLDLQMPDMDGFAVCTLLRNMFGRSRPRIVALTGHASRNNVERILAAGADSCLAKTTPAEVLLQELGLNARRAGRHGG